jgi:Flp pilus assembly protein TadG
MKLPILFKNCSLRTIRPSNGPLLLSNPESRKVSLEKVYRMNRKRRRGTAVVEFAVIAPLFFLLIFGMIEFGRVIMVQQIITNASREGARYATGLSGSITTADVISTISNNQKVIDTVKNYMSGANIKNPTVTVTAALDPLDTSNNTYMVTVKVSVPFSSVNWLSTTPFFPGLSSKVLQASTIMRLETVHQ